MKPKLGPTGDFPRGKLNKYDEGGLTIAINHDEGVVQVHFGKSIRWFGLPKNEAMALAVMIMEHAKALP